MFQPIVDRRTFAKQLAAGSLAAGPLAIVAAGAAADEPQPADKSPSPEELALKLIEQLYPQAFDETQLAEIQKQIAEDQRRSKTLSSFPLANADEPAPVFAAWRSEG
jgi:hypothetical protein